MRRKHGGRRARVRGQVKVAADFALLAAAVNLARLAVLAVASVARIGVGHRSRVNGRGGEPRLPCPAVELGAEGARQGPTDFVRSTPSRPRQSLAAGRDPVPAAHAPPPTPRSTPAT